MERELRYNRRNINKLPTAPVSSRADSASCGHRDLAVLALAAHAVVPQLALRRRRDVARADDEIAKVLALVSLARKALDHRSEYREDLGLGHGFCDAG